MAKSLPSFGMVMLLIVMAVVLVLVAQAWRSVAPAALDVNDAMQSGPIDDHGESGAGNELRKGELPRLQDAQQQTDEHNNRVQEALDAVE